MTDRGLRELHRKAAQGDVAAVARLLAERVRAGDLEGWPCPHEPPRADRGAKLAWCRLCGGTGKRPARDRLKLAACLGDEAAQVVVGVFPAADKRGCQRCSSLNPCLLHWLQGLARWGRETLVRAAIAAGRAALEKWEEADAGDIEGGYRLEAMNRDMLDGGAPRRALEAAEAWVVCPCERHAERAYRAAQADFGEEETPWELAARAVWWAQNGERFRQTSRRAWDVVACLSVKASARLTTEPAVRAAIKAELVPWCLGQGDPVKERARG